MKSKTSSSIVDGLVEFIQPIGAAHRIIEGQVGQLRNRHAASIIQDVARVAGSTSPVGVRCLTQRVTHLAV
jgi:hypothetical protein